MPAFYRQLDDQLAQCFAILGLVDPVKSSGIRMLSIDGGGTRGLMALEILDAMQVHYNAKCCISICWHMVIVFMAV